MINCVSPRSTFRSFNFFLILSFQSFQSVNQTLPFSAQKMLDTTFGLKPNWARLAKGQAGKGGGPANHIPNGEPLPKDVLSTKTVNEMINYQSWRKTSPLSVFNPKRFWYNYSRRHLGENPTYKPIVHAVVIMMAAHYIGSYSHMSKPYSKISSVESRLQRDLFNQSTLSSGYYRRGNEESISLRDR